MQEKFAGKEKMPTFAIPNKRRDKFSNKMVS